MTTDEQIKAIAESSHKLSGEILGLIGAVIATHRSSSQTLEQQLMVCSRTISNKIQSALTELSQELVKERDEAVKNIVYWRDQCADENEKRGIAEHNLDIALGDKADYVELVERERDLLKKQLAEAVKDKERLDWLEKQDCDIEIHIRQDNTYKVELNIMEEGITIDSSDAVTIRTAISTAMNNATKENL